LIVKSFKFITIFLPFYLAKQWHDNKIFLQLFMPLVGVYEFFKRPLIKSYLLPLFLIFFFGIFQSLYLHDFEGIIRCVQAIFLIYFGQFLYGIANKENHFIMIKSIFFASILYLFLEILFTDIYLKKEFIPGFHLYRFYGIVGESNFSGLLFSLMIMMCLYYRKYLWSLLYFLLIVTTMSRTYFSLAVIGVLGFFVVRNLKIKSKCLSLLGIALVILLPILLLLTEKYGSDSLKVFLAIKTNGRYPIWITHLVIFKNNPFGVGYFNAHELFQSYASQGSTIILNGKFKLVDAPLFQHNMLIHTISEFGFWGYGLLIWFLVNFTRKVYHNPEILFLFMIMLLGCCSLNIFHEFSFYFFLAFLYKEATKEIV